MNNKFWGCKQHNIAGNTEMGCSYCYYSKPENLKAYLKHKMLKVRNGALITPILREVMEIIEKSRINNQDH